MKTHQRIILEEEKDYVAKQVSTDGKIIAGGCNQEIMPYEMHFFLDKYEYKILTSMLISCQVEVLIPCTMKDQNASAWFCLEEGK